MTSVDDQLSTERELARVRHVCFAVRDKLIARGDKESWDLAYELNYACSEIDEGCKHEKTESHWTGLVRCADCKVDL